MLVVRAVRRRGGSGRARGGSGGRGGRRTVRRALRVLGLLAGGLRGGLGGLEGGLRARLDLRQGLRLVLLHLLGDSRQAAREVVDDLAAHRVLVAPDGRAQLGDLAPELVDLGAQLRRVAAAGLDLDNPRRELVLVLRQLIELFDEARHLGQGLAVLEGLARTGGILRPDRHQGGEAEQRYE